MPSINDLSESKYLTKNDVGEGKLVTITGYSRENMAMDNKPVDMCYILTLVNQAGKEIKSVVCKVTNGAMIAHIMATTYGISRDYQLDPHDPQSNPSPANEQFGNWVGKQIILYNDPTISFQGKITGGIRVRAPQAPPIQQAPQYQPPPAQNAAQFQQKYNMPPDSDTPPPPTQDPRDFGGGDPDKDYFGPK